MGFSPEVQEILDRVKSGKPKPKPEKPKSANLRPPPPVRKPSYDRAEMVVLHSRGYTVSEIAITTGAHRATVARALSAAGIPASERKGGPTRKPMCAKGLHSMDDAYELKNGGRSCRHCKKERDRRS